MTTTTSGFDFDRQIPRRGTHSSKWDMIEKLYDVPAEGALPMWVADMDFQAPPAVQEAVHAIADHGIYGYYARPESYLEAISGWMTRRHGWTPEAEWIQTSFGLINGLALCLDAYTDPGDSVVLFTPVYHAFHREIRATGREILQSRMRLEDGVYHMDLEALATQLTGREKLVILCSPHNPGGRVWTAEEIRALAEFCAAHDLLLIVDEIHHDLVMPGNTHTVAALAAPEHLDRMILMTAASKTFNLAGATTGNVIIPDPDLRKAFQAAREAGGGSLNIFGMAMTEAAYLHGDAWLDALIPYIAGNIQVLNEALNSLPGVSAMPLQATYLCWANFSGTGMDVEELNRRVVRQARVLPNAGPPFGTGGETCLRFNVACPRATVEDAAARLKEAFADLQ